MENKEIRRKLKSAFITFEGSEGSGKSIQSRLLADFLRKAGLEVVLLREPGGTRVGERIRRILLDNGNSELSMNCEILLYLASRAQLVEEKILPALRSGKTVISDRFLDATRAYQGWGGGVDMDFIERAGGFATRETEPDMTILLDVETRKGLRRSGRNDRIENRTLAYHRRVRKGYLTLAESYPRRFTVIPVKKNVKETQQMIREAVLEHFGIRCKRERKKSKGQ